MSKGVFASIHGYREVQEGLSWTVKDKKGYRWGIREVHSRMRAQHQQKYRRSLETQSVSGKEQIMQLGVGLGIYREASEAHGDDRGGPGPTKEDGFFFSGE